MTLKYLSYYPYIQHRRSMQGPSQSTKCNWWEMKPQSAWSDNHQFFCNPNLICGPHLYAWLSESNKWHSLKHLGKLHVVGSSFVHRKQSHMRCIEVVRCKWSIAFFVFPTTTLPLPPCEHPSYHLHCQNRTRPFNRHATISGQSPCFFIDM
jgi:hypothetical protein